MSAELQDSPGATRDRTRQTAGFSRRPPTALPNHLKLQKEKETKAPGCGFFKFSGPCGTPAVRPCQSDPRRRACAHVSPLPARAPLRLETDR